MKKEAPIHISNLNLVDPKTGKPTRISLRREEGTFLRSTQALSSKRM